MKTYIFFLAGLARPVDQLEKQMVMYLAGLLRLLFIIEIKEKNKGHFQGRERGVECLILSLSFFMIMASLFVNHLTTLDFSYLCPKRGLVGETWIVDVILTGDLNEEGMVFDFGHVKKQVKAWIDHLADHRLLVPLSHDKLHCTGENGYLTVRLTTDEGGLIECKAPEQAILTVAADEITPANLKPILESRVMAELPDNLSGIQLTLSPEVIDGAYYHYSHGLKKHQGDCQRIAHGHRSAINITVNGQRNPLLESDWAALWKDIYIGSEEDLLTTETIHGQEHLTFGYTAKQGDFELTIPKKCACVIQSDTTVELLVKHIAETLAAQHPGQIVQVIAYEGFNKGAIAEACC
ncbi:6-carboxytetrahydropterin synthase [Candidatus Sororendozoicomonas aggregata]|uniref:6-carboxytetrahydropterin synthase n=1 Tax=Candidatus Sororendozoicomonas aggregata TaxID=3073239 RepID=UPI002ECFB908